jgi:hypothetical protein
VKKDQKKDPSTRKDEQSRELLISCFFPFELHVKLSKKQERMKKGQKETQNSTKHKKSRKKQFQVFFQENKMD